METISITISGSFQKALDKIRLDILEFQKLGCVVLSPKMFISHRNEDSFVVLDSDGNRKPAAIHGHHLVSIKQSNFLWVRNPGGYSGTSTVLEIGYAHALGIPIFASDQAVDKSLNRFLRITQNPKSAYDLYRGIKFRTEERNRNVQTKVSHMSAQCGFDNETDEEILGLLSGEINELKHAIQEGVVDDQSHSIADELADCTIYLYHLANQCGVDLNRSINRKLLVNLERWGKRRKSA